MDDLFLGARRGLIRTATFNSNDPLRGGFYRQRRVASLGSDSQVWRQCDGRIGQSDALSNHIFPERKGFTLRFELQEMNVDLGNQLANVPPHLPRHGSSLSRRVSLRIEGSMEFQPD